MMMFRSKLMSSTLPQGKGPLVLGLFVLNLFFNIVANSSFKVSADSSNWRGLLLWQVIGNLAGFLTVVSLTWLLRYIPLHVAIPLTMGLSVAGVQVIGAKFIFHEAITLTQWLGTSLVIMGIFLIGTK
jgi:multidrug transporter EmrE-like cation transporter